MRSHRNIPTPWWQVRKECEQWGVLISSSSWVFQGVGHSRSYAGRYLMPHWLSGPARATEPATTEPVQVAQKKSSRIRGSETMTAHTITVSIDVCGFELPEALYTRCTLGRHVIAGAEEDIEATYIPRARQTNQREETHPISAAKHLSMRNSRRRWSRLLLRRRWMQWEQCSQCWWNGSAGATIPSQWAWPTH